MDLKHNNIYHLVGVSGHRDLLESDIPKYKDEIKRYLLGLKEKTEKPLLLVSPLADGADRLFVKVGIELDLPYVVVLPMPEKFYIKDFDKKSLKEFRYLAIRSKECFTLGYPNGTIDVDIEDYGPKRDELYEAVGQYICDISKDMIILWDGVFNAKKGGTSEILKYRKKQKMPFYDILCKRMQNAC